EKQHVNLKSLSESAPATVPVSALFYLTGEDEAVHPEAHELSPATSCIWLIEQSFTLDPQDAQSAAKRLAKVSELAPKVPGYEIDFPYKFDQLDDVHMMILKCMNEAEHRFEQDAELKAAS
ncbi:MAG: hypothetical protein AAFQ99_12485, partial [Pseudomonadota bacterium]